MQQSSFWVAETLIPLLLCVKLDLYINWNKIRNALIYFFFSLAPLIPTLKKMIFRKPVFKLSPIRTENHFWSSGGAILELQYLVSSLCFVKAEYACQHTKLDTHSITTIKHFPECIWRSKKIDSMNIESLTYLREA
jgi:hypothetical protein